jgi:tetraacyldisaccharide 4'-kinase
LKRNKFIEYIATPLSWLYAIGVWLRNVLYDDHILPSHTVSLPTIAIGNIAVGGTGKTPMTEYVIRLLSDKYKIAVLSRGYGRKTSGFRLAGPEDSAKTIGDEPMLIHTHFPDVPVAVCADRVEGVKKLQRLIPDLQCVVLDDAYQHRKLRCGFYILLTTYGELYVSDHLLPRGNLRDLPGESRRANMVVVTKCPSPMQPIERRIVSNQLALASYQHLCYASIEYTPITLPGNPLIIAGIANPQPLLDKLKQHYPNAEMMTFPDHHNFTKKDVYNILKKAEMHSCVVTTEKDYMRMQHTTLIEDLGEKLYVLPIKTNLGIDKEVFDRAVLLYVSENTRKL